jgi:hypothetical protein
MRCENSRSQATDPIRRSNGFEVEKTIVEVKHDPSTLVVKNRGEYINIPAVRGSMISHHSTFMTLGTPLQEVTWVKIATCGGFGEPMKAKSDLVRMSP